MGEHDFSLGPGTLYIDGNGFEITEDKEVTVETIHIDGDETKGISDFDCTYDDTMVSDYIKSNMIYNKSELTFTCKINRLTFYKLIGIWQWVYDSCPNRRVKHLMKYGKNERIKLKNYYHACNDICKVLRKK